MLVAEDTSLAMSEMCNRKRTGPSTVPWGTPLDSCLNKFSIPKKTNVNRWDPFHADFEIVTIRPSYQYGQKNVDYDVFHFYQKMTGLF